jgi:hypothetical protein
VLIISAAAGEGGDRLAALLIDVEDALRRVYEVRARSPQPTAEELAKVEEEISRFSVLARPPIGEQVTSSEQVQTYVQRLIEQDLRDAFTAAERWRPFGAIEIEVGVEDPFAIELDGVSIGATVGGRATVLDVRPGTRSVALVNEDFEEYATTISVVTAKTVFVRAEPIRKQSQLIFVLRQGVLWGGVLSAAAGVSLMIYAAAAASSHDNYNVCVGGGSCGSPYLRFGASADDQMESRDPTKSANGEGPPIVPLGYSLVGLGTAWMLGPILDDDPERIPWIEAVVGIAVFGAAFGLSLAFDRTDPVCDYHQGC